MTESYIEKNPDGTITHRPATRWRNPSNQEVRFELEWLPPRQNPAYDPRRDPHANGDTVGNSHRRPSIPRRMLIAPGEQPTYPPHDVLVTVPWLPPVAIDVRVPPGGEVVLPAEADPAIHQLREGFLVGGLGVALQRVDGGNLMPTPPSAPIHPAISAPPPTPNAANDVDARLLARAMRGQL